NRETGADPEVTASQSRHRHELQLRSVYLSFGGVQRLEERGRCGERGDLNVFIVVMEGRGVQPQLAIEEIRFYANIVSCQRLWPSGILADGSSIELSALEAGTHGRKDHHVVREAVVDAQTPCDVIS